MKKLKLILSLSILTLASACSQQGSGSANKADTSKHNTEKHNATKQEILASIYTQIIQANVEQTVKQCSRLQTGLAEQAKLEDIKTDFAAMLSQWKKVQAQYVLADLSDEAIDLPRFIDVFHVGNEDLNKQLKRAISSKSKPETALFKHSQKTINALEFVVFNDSNFTDRERALSQVINQNLCQRFKSIQQLYEQHLQDFLEDENKATALLLNILIDSSYKLREWRVGDALGLSRKYKDEPDITRFEYTQSQLSVMGINAILEAHSELMLEANRLNFADLIRKMGAQEALTEGQTHLAKANSLMQNISTSKQMMEQGEPVFVALDKLHTSYYSSLVKSMDVVAKILEADGD